MDTLSRAIAALEGRANDPATHPADAVRAYDVARGMRLARDILERDRLAWRDARIERDRVRRRAIGIFPK